MATPVSYATTTSCARSRQPSLSSSRLTWVLTVATDRYSAAATSLLDLPAATCWSTSRSRSVSCARASSAGRAAARGCRANSAISRRVIAGASRASPAATMVMASSSFSGGVSFSTNPLAPPRSASKTCSSWSKVVTMRIRGGGSWSPSRMTLVASSPPMIGIRMSISTTSGLSARAWRTAWTPSLASPTTLRPGAESTSTMNPARTSASSSAISTRISRAGRLPVPSLASPGRSAVTSVPVRRGMSTISSALPGSPGRSARISYSRPAPTPFPSGPAAGR